MSWKTIGLPQVWILQGRDDNELHVLYFVYLVGWSSFHIWPYRSPTALRTVTLPIHIRTSCCRASENACQEAIPTFSGRTGPVFWPLPFFASAVPAFSPPLLFHEPCWHAACCDEFLWKNVFHWHFPPFWTLSSVCFRVAAFKVCPFASTFSCAFLSLHPGHVFSLSTKSLGKLPKSHVKPLASKVKILSSCDCAWAW